MQDRTLLECGYCGIKLFGLPEQCPNCHRILSGFSVQKRKVQFYTTFCFRVKGRINLQWTETYPYPGRAVGLGQDVNHLVDATDVQAAKDGVLLMYERLYLSNNKGIDPLSLKSCWLNEDIEGEMVVERVPFDNNYLLAQLRGEIIRV